jgi:primosomal protein N'
MDKEITHRDHLRFIHAQNNAIDKSKYIESKKACRDLGQENFELWWIANFAKDFRLYWPQSLCYKCKHTHSCKDCLKEKDCPFFEEDKDLNGK